MTGQAPWRTKILGAALCGVCALCSGAAWAQEALRPPRTTDEPSSPKYLMFVIALLLTGGVVFVVTLKSKRGHQD